MQFKKSNCIIYRKHSEHWQWRSILISFQVFFHSCCSYCKILKSFQSFHTEAKIYSALCTLFPEGWLTRESTSATSQHFLTQLRVANVITNGSCTQDRCTPSAGTGVHWNWGTPKLGLGYLLAWTGVPPPPAGTGYTQLGYPLTPRLIKLSVVCLLQFPAGGHSCFNIVYFAFIKKCWYCRCRWHSV